MGGFLPASPTVRTADNSQLVISGAAAAGQVLKGTGPNAAQWGAAGGGFGGVAVGRPTVCDAVAIGGGTGMQIRPGSWNLGAYAAGQPAPGIINNDAQRTFGFTAAGWYRLTLFLSLGFTAAAAPLPDHFSVQFVEWNANSGYAQDVACTPGEPYVQPAQTRSLHGATVTIPSYAFYSPGQVQTLGNEIQYLIDYPGDAVPSSGQGGPMTVGMTLYVEKLG